MKRKSKFGIVIVFVFLVITLVIAFISSIEVNTIYEKIDDDTYIVNNTTKSSPFNYDSDVVYIWLTGIIIIFISMYTSFLNIKRKNINRAHIIILATIIPMIIFISFLSLIQLLGISTLADAWFFTIVTLILIAIFEYDLFGNQTLLSFFDLKLLIKILIFSTLLFIIIGVLGQLTPSFTIKTSISKTTKDQYEKYQKNIDFEFVDPSKIHKIKIPSEKLHFTF